MFTIGEPSLACSVAHERGREREKGYEITMKRDEKESDTTVYTPTHLRHRRWNAGSDLE
jgi:hypothetical protein